MPSINLPGEFSLTSEVAAEVTEGNVPRRQRGLGLKYPWGTELRRRRDYAEEYGYPDFPAVGQVRATETEVRRIALSTKYTIGCAPYEQAFNTGLRDFLTQVCRPPHKHPLHQTDATNKSREWHYIRVESGSDGQFLNSSGLMSEAQRVVQTQ